VIDKAASCDGKQCFPSWELATQHAKWMRRRENKRLDAYRCRYCRAFHIGRKHRRNRHRRVARRIQSRQPEDAGE